MVTMAARHSVDGSVLSCTHALSMLPECCCAWQGVVCCFGHAGSGPCCWPSLLVRSKFKNEVAPSVPGLQWSQTCRLCWATGTMRWQSRTAMVSVPCIARGLAATLTQQALSVGGCACGTTLRLASVPAGPPVENSSILLCPHQSFLCASQCDVLVSAWAEASASWHLLSCTARCVGAALLKLNEAPRLRWVLLQAGGSSS